MDSDDEALFAALLEEEAIAAAQDDEHLMMLAGLADLFGANKVPQRGGSKMGRRKGKERGRSEGYCLLYSDYFADVPLHGDKVFRRRYRMNRKLFLRIVNSLREYDNYFICKKDCTGTVGFSSLQKCTTAMRMLAYGTPGDEQDDYARMAESIALDCLYRFCRAIVGCFGKQYLRAPNAEDTARILAENEARGFPGMLGSIDCMHWEWKNCPFAWQGMYKDTKGHCSVVL